MTKIYVNNIEVGNSMCEMSYFEVNLKQTEETESVWQIMYYLRDFANYFAIYMYQDDDANQTEYIIDSYKFNDELDERYDAVKLDDNIDREKLIIKMILEG